MRIRNKTYICVLLAVCIMLLGTDVNSFWVAKSIPCANSDYFGPVLDESNGVSKDAGVCTTKMLSSLRDVGSTHCLTNELQQRRGIRTVSEMLCFDYMLPEAGKFSTEEELADVSYRYPEEYLTLYIHKSDGKKRFYTFSKRHV